MTDVTRESLAAALHDAECNLGRHREDRHSIADRHDENLWLQEADAILAALPSPAPEPPPTVDRLAALEGPLGHGYSPRPLWAGRCPDCGAAAGENCAILTEREGEGPVERAAQPAPDPEALRLLNRLIKTHAVYLDALNGLGHPDESHNSDFAELGISLRTADECSACAGAQYGSESDMHSAFNEARSFLSKSEARESGGEP